MEQRKYDVIVIGSGAAGMMAALTVAAAGKTCLVMEKGESLTTSNSARAGGPALAGTKVQTAEGESLTPEQLYQHMFNFSRATVNPALLRAALAEGPAVEAWLEKAGIKLFLTEDGYGVGYRARHMLMAPPQQPSSKAARFKAVGVRLGRNTASAAISATSPYPTSAKSRPKSRA